VITEPTITTSDLIASLNKHAIIGLNAKGKIEKYPSVDDFMNAFQPHGITLCDKCHKWSSGTVEHNTGDYCVTLCPGCVKKMKTAAK